MSPPKTKYTKEKILDAAFEILHQKGWEHVSARTIARFLNASTMPLYSVLSSMKELEKRLRSRAFEKLMEYQLKAYTENPYLNSAVGYVVFAREQPHLFRFLFFERPKDMDAGELHDLRRHLPKGLQDLPIDAYFGRISAREWDRVMLNAWIFTHGLAVLIFSGVLTHVKDDRIIDMLKGAGDAFNRQKSK